MTINPSNSQEVTVYEDIDYKAIGHYYNNAQISYKAYALFEILEVGVDVINPSYIYTWSGTNNTTLTIETVDTTVDLQSSRFTFNAILSDGSTSIVYGAKNNIQGTNKQIVEIVFVITGNAVDWKFLSVICTETVEASGGGIPGPLDPRALGNEKLAQTGIQFSGTGDTTLTGGAVTVTGNSLANMIPTLSTTSAPNDAIGSGTLPSYFFIVRRFLLNGNDVNNNLDYSYDIFSNPITAIPPYSKTNKRIYIGTGCISNFTSYDLDTCSLRKEADFYAFVGYGGQGATTNIENNNTNGVKTLQHFLNRYKFGGNITRNVYNISRYTCAKGTSTGTSQGLTQTEVDAISKKYLIGFGSSYYDAGNICGISYTGYSRLNWSLQAYYNYTDANCYTKGDGTEVVGITSRTYSLLSDNTGGYTYVFDSLIIPDATTVKEMTFNDVPQYSDFATVYKSVITSTGFRIRSNSRYYTGTAGQEYATTLDSATTVHLFQSYDSQGNLLA